MPIAEVRVPITLDKERTMIFNLNTMAAYEEASGKFYFDTLVHLYEVYTNNTKVPVPIDGKPAEPPMLNPLTIIRQVSMKDLRDLIWAATHEYDAKDEPRWPLTRSQVGRYLSSTTMPRYLNAVLIGHAANSPTQAELGEVSAAARTADAPASGDQTPHGNGGVPSTVLREDAFG